jgi:ATP-dependent exoDNAse (exonuclease V) beta subunit
LGWGAFSIYDASAGSGKTYALVKEYKNQYGKKMMPTEIFLPLFITIKRYEMKSRIVGSLSEFAKDEPSQQPT